MHTSRSIEAIVAKTAGGRTHFEAKTRFHPDIGELRQAQLGLGFDLALQGFFDESTVPLEGGVYVSTWWCYTVPAEAPADGVWFS